MKKVCFTLIVDSGGNGQFSTISQAVAYAGHYAGSPVTIRIAPGIYRERVEIHQPLITLEGTDAFTTILTFDDYAKSLMPNGEKRGTFRTPSFFVDAGPFSARNLTFQNSAGPGHQVGQALAAYVDADHVTFENCRFLGHQDTLFTAPLPPTAYEPNGFRGPKEFSPRLPGRHFYKSCYLEGEVDFIFGGAAAYFEDCELYSLNIGQEINGYVTAASTPKEQAWGYVFQNCRFHSNCPNRSVYLGRPWRNYAQTIILNSYLGPHIREEGWHDWNKLQARSTVFYGEYGNFGPGSVPEKRPGWIHQLSKEEASVYTKEHLLGQNW